MIEIKRGLDLPIEGAPEQTVTPAREVRSVAVTGADYVGMKPTMAVAVGDRVKLGQLLFSDKKTEGVKYTSPAAGTVSAINRGEKRVLQSVVITLEGDEEETFESWSEDKLDGLDRQQVEDNLVNSGLWTALRTRPFSKVPALGSKPNAIFVTAMDTNPLSANPEVIISEHAEDFANGLRVLGRLTDGTVYLCKAPGVSLPQAGARAEEFAGPHPAGLAGTHMHFLEPASSKRMQWSVGYQDVIAIGKLFTTGRLWVERVISIAGPQVNKPRLVRTRVGASITDLVEGELKAGENRVISGSVFGGRTTIEGFTWLGRYHNQISVLAEGRERPLLHYFTPGVNRFSVMPIYLSKLASKLFPFTTTTNGSERAMVPVGSYERIMPMDILPTQLLRALIVGDTDTAEKLGAMELDEEDLALCTFVCPGKYEYGPILRDNLTQIEREG
ncbi:Na(+)-translocating NADH-quinone reductase subunit A [Endozoicomonadaceae bacterium StTr2]